MHILILCDHGMQGMRLSATSAVATISTHKEPHPKGKDYAGFRSRVKKQALRGSSPSETSWMILYLNTVALVKACVEEARCAS